MSILLPENEKRAPGWFRANWGLMFHYLEDVTTSADAWNQRVDAFDVPGFAAQLAGAGVPYVIFTLGQNSGHYCSPNAAYDAIVGRSPSKCSRRDLIGELAAALEKVGVRFLAYVPSGAPALDPVAVERLQWKWGYEKPWPYDGKPTGERLAAFQRHWEAVLREWSLRWGPLVSGWWLDGCYFSEAMYRHADSPNFTSFAAALRAGNPASILAFNSGTDATEVLRSLTPEQDYTAGEMSFQLRVHHDGYIPLEATTNGLQTHLMTFLASNWGQGEPRFPDSLVASYTKYLRDRGCTITWDCPVTAGGVIPAPCLRQISQIQKRLL